MKIKAACIGTSERLRCALSSSLFANAILSGVVGEALGVIDVLDRPAEYYLQEADSGPAAKEGMMGVEIRLTGVSREGRTPKQFHNAMTALSLITMEAVQAIILNTEKCQIFCVIMIDGDIEIFPGTGKYGSNIESQAFVVSGLEEV